MMDREWKCTDWRIWLAHVEYIPCAAYVIRNDSSLTFIGGNQAFYRLYGCSEQEIRQRYGGRMSALMDAEPLKALPTYEGISTEPVQIRQHISHSGRDIWVITGVTVCPSEEGSVLCCISTDITQYEVQISRLSLQEEAASIATEQAGLDYLEYDFETGDAQIYSANSILPTALANEDGFCSDFVTRLLAENIICPAYESLFYKAFQSPSETERKSTYELQLQHTIRGILWLRLRICLKEDGRHAIVLWEDITGEKAAARNYINEAQFYQAILADKDAYGHVDVTENRVTRVGGMWIKTKWFGCV